MDDLGVLDARATSYKRRSFDFPLIPTKKSTDEEIIQHVHYVK